MASGRQVLTIVAMDVVGSSQLGSDQLKAKINAEIGTLLNTLAPRHGATVAKHNGDGFIVGGHDPVEMAELALQTRHHFRTTNWKKLGFPATPKVRIALNTGPVEIVNENEFSGRNVETACRIEPVTQPDSIWCSSATSQFLEEETDRIRTIDLGERQLSKNFGNLHLKALSWAHEDIPAESAPTAGARSSQASQNILYRVGVGIPGIKRDFSDAERMDFCEATFGIIRDTFDEALRLMQQRDPEIVKIRFRNVSARRFECSLAVQGKTRAQMTVWFSSDGHRSTPEIRAANEYSASGNSYNHSMSVTDSGYRLAIDPGFSSHFDRKSLTAEEAAQLLWDEFAKQLN